MARDKPTEIEYLNGEIARLGRELGVPTPLNARAVELLERVSAERCHLGARQIEQAFGARAG